MNRGQSTATAQWTKPSVDFPFEVTIETETCEPPSGSALDIGATKVTCTVENIYYDSTHMISDEENKCYFYVTVIGEYTK